MIYIPSPPRVPIYRGIHDSYVVVSAKECLDRSRRLLKRTNDMVDPMRAGIPLVRRPPALEPTPA